jgi:hypothetical protein
MKCFLTIVFLIFGVNVYSQYAEIWLDTDDTTLTNLWIDSVHSFNMSVNNKSNAIVFSNFIGKKITTVGKFKTTILNVDAVRLEDLNGDGVDEIIAATGRNMNGNQWFDVFMFVPEKNAITHSGSFNTDYQIDSINRAIKVTYTGSGYMTIYKKLYVWQGNKLLPEKMMSIKLKCETKDCDSVYVEQYKSVPAGSGNLKRIHKNLLPYGDKNTDYTWEHFFDMKTQ